MSKIIQAVEAPALPGTFNDDAPLVFPSTFIHPEAGKFRDQPEEWWKNKAVRVLMELHDGTQVPAWIDFVEFRDDPASGRRFGYGNLRSTVKGYAGVGEVPFGVEEVFDVMERLVVPEGA